LQLMPQHRLEAVGVSLAVATGSYLFVERHFRRRDRVPIAVPGEAQAAVAAQRAEIWLRSTRWCESAMRSVSGHHVSGGPSAGDLMSDGRPHRRFYAVASERMNGASFTDVRLSVYRPSAKLCLGSGEV
jgi:hypothetical protein